MDLTRRCKMKNFSKEKHRERILPSSPQFQIGGAEYSESEETPNSPLGKVQDTNICSKSQNKSQ